MLPRLFKASEHLQSEDFDKAVKAKVEIHVRSSDSRPGRERIILYSPASYPSSIKVFPWYQLVQSSDDFDLSNVLKPYVLLHKVKRHDRIRASSIYSKYAHPNLKLILIMSSNITQKHLDSDRELIDCPITIVIIPHKFKHELKDFIADATKNYEASVKPVISTKVHYFFTTANVDDVIFKRRMHEFIQERTCITMESIDDPSGKSLRLLKWILDKVNLTFLDNQFELYSVTHEDVIQHVLDLLVEKDHIDSVFSKDFIFYFCFANILHCFYSLQAYPESLKLLVYKCVTKLKEIKPTDIARYQQEFIDKGSFKIYDSHVTEINVFHLAAKSFITVSQGYLMIYPSSAAVEYAYVKILSVSIAIKFYNSCSMLKKIQKLWFKEVLQHFLSKELSESDIESFSNGLKAMSYILRDLPSLMLTWENMSTVFTAKFRSIKTLWKFIVECNEYLTRDPTGVTFVKMFFHPVTIYNEKHFTKWDDEGPVMLENIVDLIRKKEWDFHNFLPILNLWLAIFVKSIDLTHPECKEHIEILFQKSKLWSSYDTCLNEKLQQLFVEKCSKLSIDRFSDLILLGHFDKVEIYKTFLNSLSYSVKQENSIMHLLCLASKYFIEQDDPQEIFLLFFYNIGSYYVKSKRSFEFIKKILEAKIFMTESYFDGEFGKKFKNFIIDSKLQKEIYNKIFSAFDKVVVHDGAFQYEVIKVLLQEVIFSVGPVTNDAVSFFRPIFSRDCDFTVKVRAALIVFGKVVLSQSPSIEWFRDNTTKLCLIAQLISNFTSDNLAICIPESRILKNIITQFISLLRKIFDVMETKHITFGQLVVLSEHYLTYKTIYDCTLKFEYSACCAIAEERISKAIEFQSKILKLLVKEHAYGGSFITEVLSKYDISFPTVLDHLIKSSIVYTTKNTICTCEIKNECTLYSLEIIACQLEAFLNPITESLETLALLNWKGSALFNKCIMHFYKQSNKESDTDLRPRHFSDPPTFNFNGSKKLKLLNHAVECAQTVINNLIKDNVSMLTINEIFTMEDVKSIDWPNETEILHEYYYHINDTFDIKESLEATFELIEFYLYALAMQQAFKMYKLEQCLIDMDNIVKKVNYVKYALESTVTTLNAKQVVKDVKGFFGIKDIIGNSYLQLFVSKHIEQLRKLYEFACERGYQSDDGYQTFRLECQLVTVELLHENHDEQLLSAFQNTMSLVFPFLRHESSLLAFWNDIISIGNISEAISQLSFVNQGMNLIRMWFNIFEEEAPQNKEKLLRSIQSSGVYNYKFSKETGVQLTLTFMKIEERGHMHVIPQQSCLDNEDWTVSTINDFSRKLLFVNFKSPSLVYFCLKWFVQFKKIAFELLDCYSDLHCTGHPEYRKEEVRTFHLNPCFLQWREKDNIHVPSNELDSWVSGWQEGWGILMSELDLSKKKLESFKSDTKKFREEYQILSFLSTKRLISIHERIMEDFCDIETLLHEIGFLFILDINGRSCLKSTIKMIPELVSDANVHPVERVGSFLYFLVQSDIIHPYLSKCLRSDLNLNKERTFKISLISAFCYSNLELMNLILWIFKKIPSYFQLLRCSVATIEEDIELFFDRINSSDFSKMKYLILGVNTINNELQRVLLKRCSMLRSSFLDKKINYSLSLFLVEYSPSLFCHIQWIDKQEISHTCMSDVENVREKCKLERLGKEFRNFRVIYGPSGCGKTHYIRSEIKDHINKQSRKINKDQNYVSISIDETFSRKGMFKQLTKVSLQQYGMLYYYNISLFLPEESDENHKLKFNQLVDDVNWFFFDYFVLGYVEISVDTKQQSHCRSLCLPSGMSTDVYIEVPYWNVNCDVTKSFNKFCELFPALTLLGEQMIPKMEFDIEHYQGTQLVCKYLKASQNNNLDHLYTDFPGQRSSIKIGNIYQDLSAEECRSILQHNFKHSIAQSKLLQAVYLKYMERRCKLLEDCFQLCFLQDVKDGSLIKDDKGEGLTGFSPKNMRSTLFNLMKEEVEDFCKSSVIQATDEHQQVIYDVDKNGGIVFKFFCTGIPSQEKRRQLRAIGVKLEPMSDHYFHDCLSAALNVKTDDSNCITLIKEKKYVLTKDFVRKMLTIHERRECGMPVILEGETGVGKTFLLQMLSSLWNDSWKQQFLSLKNDMQNFLYELMTKVEKSVTIGARASNLILTVKTDLKASKRKISFKTLHDVLKLAVSSITYTKIKIELLKIVYDPLVGNIELPTDSHTDKPLFDFLRSIQDEKETDDTISMAHVINGILYGELKSIFYKLSLHSDMKPKKIEEFLVSVNQHALMLLECYKKHHSTVLQYQKPIITVFFDEINTSSCPGYLKEVIIDKAVNGRALAENIFIVAACNPHRGNSLAMLAKQNDSWFNASYYVQSLPHTLSILKWEYGQLEAKDENEYIHKMLLLTYEDRSKNVCKIVAEIIARAQELMRAYAFKHLKSILNTESYLEEKKAELYAKSTVSQRDIKRVFQLHVWLETWFKKDTKYGKIENDIQIMTRAFYVAVALVYYFRLNICDREDFKEQMMCYSSLFDTCGQNFVQSLNDELNWVDRVIDFSAGIAPTFALKENIYAIIICTMAHVPIFIVGPPGSSKTLSFKIAIHNCQGQESKNNELKDCNTFKCLDPHPYQCSKKSTSSEIETVFKRAINRQQTIDNTRRLAVVMMDEAGLPEDSHESLKVLHHFLDDEPLVSFVGISNDILDAAKTNRTVTMYRSEISSQDLVQLAKYSLTAGNLPISWNRDEETMITNIVEVYENLMNDSRRPHIRQFFGLRDFIHFFAYLGHSKNHQDDVIKPQAVMEALGHNFNGTKDFSSIVQVFFKAINFNPENVKKQSLIQLLQSSFRNTDRDLSSENQVRYKLLIDSSEDQSLVRLLFRFDIFRRDATKILSCSRFPFDDNSQKLYTTAAIRHAARVGHTTLIYQAEEIQENFYDLFNQRFLCINTPGTNEKVLFANVAIGTIIKPTRVSPFFNCAVIINNSDKSKTSKPFLNRFEKYSLSHEVLFQESLSSCQYHIKNILVYAKNNVEDFVKNCGKSCFYGFTEQTIDSLMLLVLPTQHVTDSANASSIGADFEPSSKVDFLALCLLRQFHLVYGTCIDVGHYELFSEAVLFAINSISKNDKDIVQKFLDDPIDFESINEVARMTVKGNKVSSQLSLKLLQELIVIFLHYQLIRIMSPEGLVTCCGTDETIPDFYKKCYIRYQHHFSLHNFIQEQYQLLDKRKEFVAKKFLCFTHTSQSIMEMIPNYTSCHSKYTQEKEKMQEFFCFDEERKFHTYIMSHATSQEKIQDILRMFLECDNSNTPTEVLLLFANMNELAKDTINHARILIEESECFYQQLHCNKLIFFILHFPPQMFYNCCYPTLFLDGWQHVYLDKIGEMKGVQYINIEKWLDICLLEKSTASSECKMHDIFVHDFVWTDLLSETIVLSSGSITMKQLKDFPPKDAQFQEICLYWTALLKIDEISSVLSKRFYSFWQQEAMHELTFKIARFAVTYRSSCTLSQAVEETIKSSYKELVLYFICIMNQQFVMHTLHQYDENIVPNTKLICEILSILPIPDSLQQLQLEVAILTKQSHIDTVKDFSSPKIPFFNLIFDAMENIINQVFKQYLQSVDINDEEEYLENSETTWAHDINSASTDNDKDHIIKKTEELIEQSKDDCLIIKFAIGAMKVNEEFWDYYLEDSLSRKLSRDVCIFTKQFFNLASIQSDDFTRRFISLHYHLRLYRLDSHYLSLLRLLDECVCYIDTYHVESQLLSNLNKNSVLTTGIDVLYTSLGSLHKSGKCAKFYELSDLFYQVISNFKSHDDLDLDSVTKKKLIVLSIIYFVNNLKRRDEIILQPFDNFVLKLMEAANIISEKYIKAVSLAQLVQEYFDDVRHSHFVICEHIVEYYVNQHIHDMTDEDIKWIWEVMNRIELEHDLSSSWLQSKFKYHLKKLLENPQEAHIYGTRELTGVLLFNDRVRSILGSVIDSKDPSSCFNYYPYDYRNCASLRFKLQKSINVPLCDTYYEIVLEKLQSYDSSISDVVLFSNMLSFYERLADSIKSETCQSKKKLLVIEKQAVIQIVIEKLAHIVVQHDGSTDENMIGIIETVLDESNAVSSTAAISDNSLILLMRVLQVCRNERKLKVELVDNIDNISLLTSFKCVRQITAVLKFNQIPNEGFLPFLSQCYSSQMTLFNSVHEAMKSIIKYPGKKQKIEPIHRIAVKCNASKQEKFTFIMSVFLSAHIEFFVNKKNSHRILPILSEELFQYIGKEYWCFIDWMANPMPDSPMSLSNQELHNFFVQPNEDNQMHIQCLIELAAVVLGSSSDSHFWTHLFEPNNIKTDFLPGSIITGCVDAKYLKVMSLKDTPISYTHRMSLNWFSLLVLQWMNYGLLCIAMVVNSTRHHQDLVHPIWSNEQLPSPQEAMLHLNVLWEKIAIDCNITIDERDCLMFSCIQNLYKAFMKHELQSHWSILNSNNTCTTQDEFLKALRQYEITVHTNVFVPAWNSLKKREHFNRFGDPIVNNLRDLRNNVKQLQIYGGTQLDDFLTILLSSTMLHDKKCELFTLYQFILTRPALNVGAIVLPKLVDLYCWIHNNLQFKVTFEIARSQSVRTVLESLLDQFFPGKKVKEMTKIEVMIEQYGNLRHFFKCLPEISTDMKFYHLLHMINGSKDVLFKAITEIVERYNSFLDDHQLNISTKGRFIHVTEVTEESCLFANLRSIDKLLSYRNLQDLKTIILKYCSMRNIGKSGPESDNSIIPDCVPELNSVASEWHSLVIELQNVLILLQYVYELKVFHFKAIQNEIFSLFISHKQKISLENFWKKFDFYKSMQNISPQSLFHSSVHYKEVIEIIEAQYPHLAKDKADEISTINENMDPNDEALLPSVIELENTFHSLNHDSLVELCSGLFLILQKILEKIPKVDDTHIYSLRSLTICEFLSESCSDMNDALNHVGIVKHSADRTRSSLSESQYKFISDTRLNAVVYLTKFFQDWLEIGYYDFHHLPFCMKSHLVEDIQHDITEWMQNQETLKIVTDLAYFMFKFEKDLVEKACCNNDTAIGEVINEELDIIPVWLPKVSVKYYVHIHLELRKKLFEREEQPESQSNLSEGPPEEVNPQKESTPPPIVKSSSVVSIPSLPQTIIPVPFINEIDTKESELRKLAEMKTAKDVAEFMNAEGFHETAGIFSEDEDMDGLVVYELLSDDEILRKDFALHTALLRLKFRILFKRWLTNSVSLLGQVSPDKVAQLFWRHNRLKEFCEVIKKEQIDGEMLEMAKTPELEDLGIIGIPCTIVPKVVKEIKEQLSVMCPVCNCKIETASASVKLFSCLHCVHNVCFEKLMLKNCPECRNPIH